LKQRDDEILHIMRVRNGFLLTVPKVGNRIADSSKKGNTAWISAVRKGLMEFWINPDEMFEKWRAFVYVERRPYETGGIGSGYPKLEEFKAIIKI
jgi:hypothetical protein